MKRLLSTIALALASAATAAAAMIPTPAQTEKIHHYAPMADVPALSDAQLNGLMEIIESNASENDKRIRAGMVLQRRGTLLWN